MILNHSSPHRLLIQLKIEHADLNALVDKAVHAPHIDELLMKRLKKRRLQLRDRISRLEASLTPPEPA
ncbi:YdcH family protein [Polaromonas sp. DSR2-3-2]|uniref:YdcH family protein n=1 Tax=unclassified Polaromonas TaxID=2638319 RepID=UPI003CEB6DF7